jgi:hypothetical protein
LKQIAKGSFPYPCHLLLAKNVLAGFLDRLEQSPQSLCYEVVHSPHE